MKQTDVLLLCLKIQKRIHEKTNSAQSNPRGRRTLVVHSSTLPSKRKLFFNFTSGVSSRSAQNFLTGNQSVCLDKVSTPSTFGWWWSADFSRKIRSTVTSLTAIFSGIWKRNSSSNVGFSDRSAVFVRLISKISNGLWKMASTYVSREQNVPFLRTISWANIYLALVVIVQLASDSLWQYESTAAVSRTDMRLRFQLVRRWSHEKARRVLE